MWKYPFALAVTAAMITGSVYLFRHRAELFRPDVRKVGGTLIAFDVVEGDPDEDCRERLRKRFDPKGAFGVVVRTSEDGRRVEFLVPKGDEHDDLVERVKRLGGRPGRSVFSTIAGAQDEGVMAHLAAVSAAREKGKPLTAWPTPPADKLGSRDFLCSAGLPPRRYRWVRLAEPVVGVFSLDPTALSARNHAEQAAVNRALASGTIFRPTYLPGSVALAARLPGEKEPAYFVLVQEDDLDPLTGDNILHADRIRDPGTKLIRLRFDREGAGRMAARYNLSRSYNIHRPSPPHISGSSVVSEENFLALVIDDEVVTMPQMLGGGLSDLQLNPGTSDEEAEDLACLLRASVKGVRLSPRPSQVTTIEPRR